MCVVVGMLSHSFSTQIATDGWRVPRGVGIQEANLNCPTFSFAGSPLDEPQGEGRLSKNYLAKTDWYAAFLGAPYLDLGNVETSLITNTSCVK